MIMSFAGYFILLGILGLASLLAGLGKRDRSLTRVGLVFAGLALAGLSFDIYRVAHTADEFGPDPKPTFGENVFYGLFLGIGLGIAIIGLLYPRMISRRSAADSKS